MPNLSKHWGFCKQYDKLARSLITPVNVLPTMSTDETLQKTPAGLKALWDTGATKSCICPDVMNRLKLRILRVGSPITLAGVGGSVKADFTVVSISLTGDLIVEYCPLYVLDFPGGADILIGMDIISKGDFAISNAENKTLFSFAMPSFSDRINLAEKAEIANKQS